MVCPACEREPLERKHLVSQLNRVNALKQLCTVLGEAIANDAGLVDQSVGHCRRAAEEHQSPDPDRREHLLERKQRLTRSMKLLTRQEPGSDSEECELEAALREKRSDLAEVETQLAQIDNAAGSVIRIPTAEEVQVELQQCSERLLQIAREGAPAEIDTLKELLKRLTGGRIILEQRGERKRQRGWLEGRFVAPLVPIVAEAVAGVALPADDLGIEIRVEFRREAIDAERMQRAWELYQQGRMQKDIAEELGCSRSNVTRLLRKAAELRGEPFEDGRKLRRRLPKDQDQPPVYVAIGDRAVELWNSGKSYREIGSECGCSDATVQKAIRHWHESRGLPVPTLESRRAAQSALAEQLEAAGLSWEEIATRIGVSTATLRSWCEPSAA